MAKRTSLLEDGFPVTTLGFWTRIPVLNSSAGYTLHTLQYCVWYLAIGFFLFLILSLLYEFRLLKLNEIFKIEFVSYLLQVTKILLHGNSLSPNVLTYPRFIIPIAWHLARSKLNLHNSKTPQAQLNSALIETDLYMPNSNFSIY